MQTAKERGADVSFISEQYKWSENSAWYQDASRRAGILVCGPDLSIGDFLEVDAGFVWVEMAGVRVDSCFFSPNDPFAIFETKIIPLEEGLASDRLVGGSLLRATLIVSRPSGAKPAWTEGGFWSAKSPLGMT